MALDDEVAMTAHGSDWKFSRATREGNCFPGMARVTLSVGWGVLREEIGSDNGNREGRVQVGKATQSSTLSASFSSPSCSFSLSDKQTPSF